MAETVTGFDTNAGISEADFANLSIFLGSSLPLINTVGTHNVTAGTTAMTVDVSNGTSYVPGVRHNITTTTNLTIAPVTLAGATRWDAVVKRFDWSTNAVTFLVVQGTAAVNASKVAPGGLNSTPGDKYDQVLALVKATNGSNALEIAPRHVYGSKHFTVNVPDALPTPTTALYGATCYVASSVTSEKKVYRCLLVSGSPAWVADTVSQVVLTGTSALSTAANWTLTQASGSNVLLPCRGIYDPQSGHVQVDFQVRRSASAISPFNSTGGIPVSVVGTLPTTLAPDADVIPMPFNGQYTTSGGTDNSWRNASFTVDAVGVVRLHQVSAEDVLAITSGVSLRAHLTFTKRT